MTAEDRLRRHITDLAQAAPVGTDGWERIEERLNRRHRARSLRRRGAVVLAVTALVAVAIGVLHGGRTPRTQKLRVGEPVPSVAQVTPPATATATPTATQAATPGAPTNSPRSTGPALPAVAYLTPVPASGQGSLSSCPNPEGLEAFTTATVSAAVNEARQYDVVDKATDRLNSDPSWWPAVDQDWSSGRPGQGLVNETVVGSSPASQSPYAMIVVASCGQPLVQRSLSVQVGPAQSGPNQCEACKSTLFFIVRAGRPLLYYVY